MDSGDKVYCKSIREDTGEWVYQIGNPLEMSRTAHDVLTNQLPSAIELFLRKNKGYGDMADVLGSRAQFVDMHRKMDKLKRGLWEGQDIGDETIQEVTLDLFGHVLLMLRTLAEESDRGPF